MTTTGTLVDSGTSARFQHLLIRGNDSQDPSSRSVSRAAWIKRSSNPLSNILKLPPQLLLTMIVGAIFLVAGLATSAAGIVGAFLGRLMIGDRLAAPRRRWIILGVVAGVVGGFLGTVGLSSVNVVFGTDLSALFPVALISAGISGFASPVLDRTRRERRTGEGPRPHPSTR